jgi:hypothetical protein
MLETSLTGAAHVRPRPPNLLLFLRGEIHIIICIILIRIILWVIDITSIASSIISTTIVFHMAPTLQGLLLRLSAGFAVGLAAGAKVIRLRDGIDCGLRKHTVGGGINFIIIRTRELVLIEPILQGTGVHRIFGNQNARRTGRRERSAVKQGISLNTVLSSRINEKSRLPTDLRGRMRGCMSITNITNTCASARNGTATRSAIIITNTSPTGPRTSRPYAVTGTGIASTRKRLPTATSSGGEWLITLRHQISEYEIRISQIHRTKL